MRSVLISILLSFASTAGAVSDEIPRPAPDPVLLASVENAMPPAGNTNSSVAIPVRLLASDDDFLRRFGPNSESVVGHVHFRSMEIMSGLREDRAYGDDPEGALWLIPVNWDIRTGTLISIQAIFGELPRSEPAYAAIALNLRDALVQQVWNGKPEAWAQAINREVKGDPMSLSVFTFVPSTVPDKIGGIAWHFEPERVAPLSRGIISIVIAQERLRNIIRPEWQGLFAGEPVPIPAAQQMLEAERLAGNNHF